MDCTDCSCYIPQENEKYFPRVKFKTVDLRHGMIAKVYLDAGRWDLVERVDPDLAALMRKEW